MLFALENVEFTDKRLTQEEFAAVKADLPSGQLPLLEIEGKSKN